MNKFNLTELSGMMKLGQCWRLMKFNNVCSLWYCWMNFDLNIVGIGIMRIWCVGLLKQTHLWWVWKFCLNVLFHEYGNFYGYGYGKILWWYVYFVLNVEFFFFFIIIIIFFFFWFWHGQFLDIKVFWTWRIFFWMSILGHGVLWTLLGHMWFTC